MALLSKKSTKKTAKVQPTEEFKKMSLYVTIVNKGQSTPVIKIFERAGVSAQFVQIGRGTAQKQVLDILGIADNAKEIVLSFIKKESIPEAKTELEAFFAASKRNNGIGFSIPLTSLVGRKVYQFLANDL